MSDKEVIPATGSADVKTFKILLDGEEMDAKYQLQRIVVSKEANRIPYAVVTILDGEASERKFEASDSRFFDPGKKLEIQAGYNSEDKTIFKGVVVKQGIRVGKDSSSILRIEAKDEFAGLCIGRKSKYFYDSPDSEIIDKILKEHEKDFKANTGRKYELTKAIEETELEHVEMVQYDCSDWDFIVTRAEMNGMLVLLNDGEFKVAKPKIEGDPKTTLIFGATIFEFESEIDAQSQYGSVETTLWKINDQKEETLTSKEPKLGDQGKISGEDLSKVLGTSVFGMHHTGNFVDKELQSWTDAQLLKSRLARIRGRVKCQGFSDVNIGDVIALEGVGDHYNGSVYTTAIRHVITSENWEVDLQFGLKEDWFSNQQDIMDPPASGMVAGVNGLQIGVVSKIEDDPDSEFRLLVRTPMISEKEDGVWARVALLDAGMKRGTYFRPEVGDEVVLGYLNDDPRDPIVLGSLHSSKNESPIQPTKENDEKGIFSRSEMKFTFDDEKKLITIQTADDANKILLDEENGGIFIEDENGNKIEMTSDGITIESAKDIVLKAGGDINLEGVNISGAANAELKMEGTAGAEVSSNGISVLKGSLVQIN